MTYDYLGLHTIITKGRARAREENEKNAFFLHFFAKKFGHVKKKQYLCTRFRKQSTLIFTLEFKKLRK